MVKRNTPKKQKRKPTTSGGTPQGGDRLKVRRMKEDKKLTENEQPIPDLEPDGLPGTNPTRPTNGNQYEALSDEEDVEMEDVSHQDNDDKHEETQLTLYTTRTLTDPTGNQNEAAAAAAANEPPPDTEEEQSFQLVASRPTRNRPIINQRTPPKKSKKNQKNENAKTPPALKSSLKTPAHPTNLSTKGKHPAPNTKTPKFAPDPAEDTPNTKKAKEDADDEEDSDYEYFEITDGPVHIGMDPITNTEIFQLVTDAHTSLEDIKKTLDFGPAEDDIPLVDLTQESDQSMIEFEYPKDTNNKLLLSPDTPATADDMDTEEHVGDGSPLERTALSYAEAAQGTDLEFNPRVNDTTRNIRFSVRIEIPPQDDQFKALCMALINIMTLAQQVFSKDIGYAVWNPDFIGSPAPPIYKVKDLPQGEPTNQSLNKAVIQRYFDHWANGQEQAGKPKIAFVKIRFVTKDPSKLPFPLTQLGIQLGPTLQDCQDPKKDTKIALSRQPIACQCPRSSTVGWLFGSYKTMNEDTLINGLRQELNIPLHVALGLRWRGIRNAQKTTIPFEKDKHGTTLPPQALHLEIDEVWYGRYAADIAKLWKKDTRKRVCGIQFQLIPCFTSPRMVASDDATRMAVSMMSYKQKSFVNDHCKKTSPTYFIAFLDYPINIGTATNPKDNWTLRRHLMKAAPPGLHSHRLFVTVDLVYNGHGHIMVTTHSLFAEAERTISNMIPECLHLYGAPARKWFTPAGLEAYKDTKWDPTLKTTSSNNHDMTDCIDENFMGMGTGWKPQAVSTRPLAPTPRTPAALNPTALATTATEVLADIAKNNGRSDASIKSFGDKIFDREHDGNTVHTNALNDPDPHPPESLRTTTVQLDLTGMEFDNLPRNPADEESLSMSTMAHTTEDTRRRLKESDKQRNLLTAENEYQANELEAKDRENDQLQQANTLLMAKLALFQQRLDEAAVLTPPAPRRTVNILEPDKGSNLARSETQPTSRPDTSPPSRSSATSRHRDGEIADTVVAGIGHHG